MKIYPESFGKEGCLSQSLSEHLEIIYLCFLEYFLIGKEGHLGTVLIFFTLTYNCELLGNVSPGEALFIYLSVSIYIYGEPLGQGVNYGCTHTVESSGYFVSASAKLSSGMEHCKYHFKCRLSCLVIYSYRYSSSVVFHRYGIILIDPYMDVVAYPCQSFVHRIIHYLIYKMVKSSAGCGTYIHSRTFSYRFQSFKYLYLIGTIFNICC